MYTPLDEDTLRRLYVEERKTLRDIAGPLGVSAGLVRQWLLAAGIPTRSISEARRIAKPFQYTPEGLASKRRQAALMRSRITAESHAKRGESLKGKPAWNKGKPWPEETRLKLVALWDPERRRRQSERMSGPNHYGWKGGQKSESAMRLDRMEWRRLRLGVYARDNWMCQDCGRKCKNTRDSRGDGKAKIQAHHIVPRRYGGGDELENLVTLCMSCHHKRERKISA